MYKDPKKSHVDKTLEGELLKYELCKSIDTTL